MMRQVSNARAAMAVLLTAAALLTGCAATPQAAPGVAATTTGPTIPLLATTNSHTSTFTQKPSDGGRGGDRSTAAPAGRPADWPPDLPLPAGTITGSTGSQGRWTVLIVAAGSATEVRQSAAALYVADGFTAISDSVLNRGNRQITLVVENRDHSATQTDLIIQVSTI